MQIFHPLRLRHFFKKMKFRPLKDFSLYEKKIRLKYQCGFRFHAMRATEAGHVTPVSSSLVLLLLLFVFIKLIIWFCLD